VSLVDNGGVTPSNKRTVGKAIHCTAALLVCWRNSCECEPSSKCTVYISKLLGRRVECLAGKQAKSKTKKIPAAEEVSPDDANKRKYTGRHAAWYWGLSPLHWFTKSNGSFRLQLEMNCHRWQSERVVSM